MTRRADQPPRPSPPPAASRPLPAGEAFVEVCPGGKISSWSNAAERIYGYIAPEVVGRPVRMLLPSEPTPEAEVLLAHLLRGEELAECTMPHRMKDGRVRTVSVGALPMHRADGQFSHSVLRVRPPGRHDASGVVLERRKDQQTALARLGATVARGAAFDAVCAGAFEAIADSFDGASVMLLEYRPGGVHGMLHASAGHPALAAPLAPAEAVPETDAGRALETGRPVHAPDFELEASLRPVHPDRTPPPRAGISAVIPGRAHPFGVLVVHQFQPVAYTEDDVFFVQAVAHLVGAAGGRADAALQASHISLEARMTHRTMALASTNALLKKEVAERKRVERTLRRETAFRERLLAHSLDGLFAFDADGRLTVWNAAMETLTRIASAQCLGRRAVDVLPFLEEIGEHHHIEAVLRGEHVVSTDRPYVIAESNRIGFFEAHYTPLRNEAGDVYGGLALIRDLTARKTLDERLQAAQRRLVERNRDLQEFSFMASHDLQEPLRKMSTFSEILRSEYYDALDGTARLYIDRIQASSLRVSELMRALLAYSSVMTHGRSFSPVRLDEIARSVIEDSDFAPYRSHIEIKPLPVIQADASQMRQLFAQLLDNAVKYRREAAPLRIQISALIIDGPEASSQCRMLIRDNGVGFDEKYTDRIFSPFQRLQHRGEIPGTGIGLAICRRIVERHGGSITADSTRGEGTCFTVTLPVRQRPAS